MSTTEGIDAIRQLWPVRAYEKRTELTKASG